MTSEERHPKKNWTVPKTERYFDEFSRFDCNLTKAILAFRGSVTEQLDEIEGFARAVFGCWNVLYSYARELEEENKRLKGAKDDKCTGNA